MYRIKLSPFSKPFYYEWKSNLQSGDRNLVTDMFIYGKIDVSKLKQAINNFVNSHVLINSHILFDQEELFWVKNTNFNELQYSETDFSDEELFDYISKPFDLELGPLYRSLLIKQKPNKYRLTIVCHHIVIDGRSRQMGVLDHLINYYNDANYKSQYSIKEQIDLINDLNLKLTGLIESNLNKYKSFWKKKLADINPIDTKFLSISKDENLINKANRDLIKDLVFGFSKEQSIKVSSVTRNYKITPFMFGQMVLACLIYRYTGQNDFGISCPTAINEGGNFIYGAHVNTIIIPYHFKSSNSILEIIKQVRTFFKSLKDDNINYRYCPFNEIIKFNDKSILDIGIVQSLNPGLNAQFSENNILELFIYSRTDASYKVFFEYEVAHGVINYRVRFNKQLIDEVLLTKFIESYNRLFMLIVNDLHSKVDNTLENYAILENKDYATIIQSYSQGMELPLKPALIHRLFEDQVSKTPDNIAIEIGELQITYLELNRRANQLANYLVTNYILESEELVVLFLDSKIEILVAILAILKAGAAYVPVSINLVPERLKHILNDTKTRIIITNQIYLDRVESILLSYNANSDNETISVGLLESSLLQNRINLIVPDLIQDEVDLFADSNLKIDINTNQLACVIYTSGSTGTPKGVMVEHQNMTCFIDGLYNKFFNSDSSLNILSTTNYTFDIFGLEYMLPLFHGYTMHVLDFMYFYQGINLDEYDIIQITPSKLPMLLEHAEISSKLGLLPRKILILLGGEMVTQTTINYLRTLDQMFKSRSDLTLEVINIYGPTETTIWSTAGILEYNSENAFNNINIGTPLPNQQVYVLDNNQNILPIGSVGELYISGIGITRGYLNQPELTQHKFINHKFHEDVANINNKTIRLYKTGDLVRWHTRGYLEYIGRTDSQVKIRGNRVELKEVENKLIHYPGIKQAKVFAIPTEDQKNIRLIGYYVSDEFIKKDKLINYLRNNLFEYMIPSVLVPLKQFPINDNGKLDIKSLSNIKLPEIESYVPPTSQLENSIIKIWSDVLNIPKTRIGVTNSFFELGGDSILIVNLRNRLSKLEEFTNIEVADLFKYTTVQQLIEFTNDTNNGKIKIINKNNIIDKDKIAIISMSGAFSGADNLDEYWDLIQSGREGVKVFTQEECKNLGVLEDLFLNPNYIPVSGHIKDINKFDASFWGLSQKDASSLDPQIRKLLEHAWYLLDNAGYINQLADVNIGVFVGSGQSRYSSSTNDPQDTLNIWEAANFNSTTTLATRISYLLGLTGPANNINTACSTSLVAIIEACKNLVSGYCDMAIAGGVTLLMPNETGYIYQEGMILSKDGHCRPFDNDASGTIAGSGVGLVLLKRLSDAIKDQDNIVAVIQGYATNNDGNRKLSFTAPSILGQKECIVNAQLSAEITSDQIDYIECHGTGTRLGDPIELKALHEAFIANDNKMNDHKCILGSVKANIGHTDTAAGVAGVIKVCKMFEQNIIPQQINYAIPNSEINFKEKNFAIVTKNLSWNNQKSKPRFAGVSSFGIGGTNAHIILSDFNEHDKIIKHNSDNIDREKLKYILPISAKSIQSLELYLQDFINYLETTKDSIQDIAYTLQIHKKAFQYKLAIVCDSVVDAIEKFKNFNANAIFKSEGITSSQNVVFMFPGQGSQYPNMGADLYKNSLEYKEIVDECLEIVNKEKNIDFAQVLFPEIFNNGNQTYDINQTEFAQPAIFIISYSLAILLEKFGISPSVYLGNSLGELVAATLSGVFSLDDAIKIVIARGQLMQSMQAGKMLAVDIGPIEIKQFIDNKCELAVVTSPKSCIVSGNEEDITVLKSTLDKNGIGSILLSVSHAYHSYLMEDAAKELIHKFDGITLNVPKRKFISNLTGDFITDEDAISPYYWSKHMRNTVELGKGIETIFNNYESPFFIEVGPCKSLITSTITKNNKGMHKYIGIQILNSYKQSNVQDSIYYKEDILSRLWLNGYKVDFKKYYNSAYNVCVPIPRYHFDSKIAYNKSLISENYNKLTLLPSDRWISAPVWKRVSKLSKNEMPKVNLNILIFKNILCNSFDFLERFGTVFIEINNEIESYQYLDNGRLVINSGSEDAYKEIMKYLSINKIEPNIVIHAVTAEKIPMKWNKVDDELIKGYYSIFLLKKEILDTMYCIKRFIVLTQGLLKIDEYDNINPCNGSLVGMIRTIKHENVNINSCIVDIECSSRVNPDILLNFILNENSYISQNPYAFRFGYLWLESFENISIDHSNNKNIIEEKDVILITGGMGEIGLAIAKKISTLYNVTFILVGRTNVLDKNISDKLIQHKLTIIKEIEDSGSKVVIKTCDISSRHKISALINGLQEEYKYISGIIHAAGMAPIPCNQKTFKNIKLAAQAKIHGSANLIYALENTAKIKYFVAISSLASTLGDINRIEYCATNSFLDYLSESTTPYLDSCRLLTINWPSWKETAMLKSVDMSNQYYKFISDSSITNLEGGELFENLIKNVNISHAIVSKFDISEVINNAFRVSSHIGEDNIENICGLVVEENLTEKHYQIAKIFLDLLQVEKISIYDNFFKHGGTSLDAIKLITELKKYEINLSLLDITLYNTIEKIYKFHIDAKNKDSVNKILIPLALHNKSNKNIFFIHPIGGSVIFYLDIIEGLPKIYNYYGIQNINISGVQLIKTSNFEELCKIYVEEILKIQPDGEYIFIGSSMGGNLSFEMGRQLSASGKFIKYLIMLDSWTIFNNNYKNEATFKSIMQDQIQYDKRLLNISNDFDIDILLNARWQLMQLLINYKPRKFDTKILLLKAMIEDKLNFSKDGSLDNGWQQFTDVPVEVFKVPGNHETMHIGIGLKEIIRILNNILLN